MDRAQRRRSGVGHQSVRMTHCGTVTDTQESCAPRGGELSRQAASVCQEYSRRERPILSSSREVFVHLSARKAPINDASVCASEGCDEQEERTSSCQSSEQQDGESPRRSERRARSTGADRSGITGQHWRNHGHVVEVGADILLDLFISIEPLRVGECIELECVKNRWRISQPVVGRRVNVFP